MKNKAKSIFSTGLYLEGLRQTRYIGLPFLCLGALCEGYVFINNLSAAGGASTWISYLLAFLSFCVVAPLCTLTLYHFLNSRAASDYYHSIPRTRTALCCSFAAAAFTWAVGPVLLSAAWERIFP